VPVELRGREEPRLASEPLGRLTKHTSLGYEAIEFAEEMLGMTLLPWQKWWLIHALEIDSNGGFRFRTVLTCVGRQNGKTTLLVIVSLWMMYMGRVRLVLGAAQALDIARESWQTAVDIAESDAELRAEISSVKRGNNLITMDLQNGARYRIAAATRSAGRGLSVDLLILDELREHRDWAPWSALSKTTTARPNALTVCISNAGDDESVVLNALRDRAMSGADPALALFEWSAPEGCELDDRQAWAQANPGLGYTITEQAIASALGTDPPGVFRTETLCQRVDSLETPIDLGAWRSSSDPAGSLDDVRDRVRLCVDASPDGQHVTLIAAAPLDDGRIRAEAVAHWFDVETMTRELPDLVDKIKPVATGWFPGGPMGQAASTMRTLAERGHRVDEITGVRVQEACMELASLVLARRVVHPNDPLINAHLAGAGKLARGDGWVVSRRGAGHVDAVYALGGAVQLALTVAEAKAKPRPMVV